MLLLNKFYDSVWAATPDVIRQIEEVLLRHQETKFTVEDLKALESRIGKPLGNSQSVHMRGSTAVIPIIGSITRRATMFSDVSGMTSTEKIAKDFTAALESPEVQSIVLDIDSGGGEASSISELSGLIREGSTQKPVYAYSGGTCCSAAYWIAASVQPGNIVGSSTTSAGSIGVAIFYDDNSEAAARQGVKHLVFKSTKTPDKLPDPATKHGSKLIQDKLDAIYSVFKDDIIKLRDNKVDPDKLAGRTCIGADAVSMGLIDRLGSFESLIKELNPKEKIMDNPITEISVETASKEKFEALEAQIKAYTEKESTYAAQIKEYEEKLQAAEEFEALAQEKLLVAEAEQAATSLGGKLTPTQKPFYVELYKEVSGDPKMLEALDAIVGTQIDIKVLTEEQLADEDLLVLTDEIPADELSELKKETAEFLKKENKHVKR